MKILLCQINSKYIHSSLAVWYLYESIRKKCPEEIIPAVFEATVNSDIKKVFDDIKEHNADAISFSCYIWNIEFVKELITMLYNDNKDVKIILGGPEATFDTENLLDFSSAVKYVIRGEGEEALPALLRGEIIKGISFKGNISPLADNVSYLSPYCEEYFESLNRRIVYFEASRGCPFSCSFCLSGREDMLRLFDIDTIKGNILKLAASGTKTVKFVDRTFNCNLSRAKEIVGFILNEYGNKIPKGVCFHFEVAADLFDDELINLLNSAPAGLFQIEAGIQSFNEKTLSECTRKTNLKKVAGNLKKLIKSRKLHVHTDLIAGLPYENFESFKNSYNKAYALESDMLQLGFLKFLKGSKIDAEKEIMGAFHNNKAPYELICNQWLSTEEIDILKKAEEATDKIYNSGRFARTLKYLLKTTGLSPFELMVDLSGLLNQGASLNELANKIYEYYSSVCEPELLRDIMVCDFLSSNASGRLPSALYRFDKDLSKVRKNLSGRKGSAMLYYNKKRAVVANYDNPPHPVTGRFALQYNYFEK